MKTLTKYALWIGALQAWAAVFGSIFISEISSFMYQRVMVLMPCDLCWWQRAMFYPLAPIYTLAIIRKEPRTAAIYSIPMVIVGWLIAFYQILLQQGYIDLGTCSLSTIACSKPQLPFMGFDLIPAMSFAGFTVMIAVTWTILKTTSKAK